MITGTTTGLDDVKTVTRITSSDDKVENFRVDPRLHPTFVGCNLGLIREFPTSAVMVLHMNDYRRRELNIINDAAPIE